MSLHDVPGFQPFFILPIDFIRSFQNLKYMKLSIYLYVNSLYNKGTGVDRVVSCSED